MSIAEGQADRILLVAVIRFHKERQNYLYESPVLGGGTKNTKHWINHAPLFLIQHHLALQNFLSSFTCFQLLSEASVHGATGEDRDGVRL